MAAAGLVLAIIAFVLALFPLIQGLGLVPAALGVIFSSVALDRARRVGHHKGLAIAGLTLSIVALAGTVLSFFIVKVVSSEMLFRMKR